jgi:prolyl oligopeptidase
MLKRLSPLPAALFLVISIPAMALASEDEFLWLESAKDPAALAWVANQRALAETALKALPHYAEVSKELSTSQAAAPAPPSFSVMGRKVVRFQRDPSHPHGVLSVATRGGNGSIGPWRVVLDVDGLGKAEGKAYELQWGSGDACLPPAYERCLLSLSPGGGDAAELREFDLERGQFVEGGFRTAAAGRVDAVWLNQDRVLIADALPGRTVTLGGWSADVQLWKRGQPLQEAHVIWSASQGDAVVLLGAVGLGSARRGIISDVLDYSYRFKMITVDQEGRLQAVGLPDKLKPFGLLGVTDRHIIVQLATPASIEGKPYQAEDVLTYDVSSVDPDHHVSLVYSPKEGDIVASASFGGIAGTRSAVTMVVANRLRSRIVTARLKAARWALQENKTEDPGTTPAIAASDPNGDDLIESRSGYLTPLQTDLVSPGRAPLRLYAQAPVFDASAFKVEIRTATSADGTAIDYYLLRPKKDAAPGALPILMTGYGGFGFSYTPGYLDGWVGGYSFLSWLNRGGGLAVPIIRGGGERGEMWHQAAMREKHQRSYDDFEAVASDLIAKGITSAKHLGVFGSSNGGLLAAAVAVQRPDLFGAVVSDAPVLDMLRYTDMGIGGGMMQEFGDPRDPSMRDAILGWSPYQNVKPTASYPPMLFTVSTEDNRVGPGHSRKMVALLEKYHKPVYLLEEPEGGHSMSNSIERPDLMAMRLAFLIDTLMPPN